MYSNGSLLFSSDIDNKNEIFICFYFILQFWSDCIVPHFNHLPFLCFALIFVIIVPFFNRLDSALQSSPRISIVNDLSVVSIWRALTSTFFPGVFGSHFGCPLHNIVVFSIVNVKQFGSFRNIAAKSLGRIMLFERSRSRYPTTDESPEMGGLARSCPSISPCYMVARSLDKFHPVVKRAFLFPLLAKMSVQNYNSSACSVAKYQMFQLVPFLINLV